MKSRGCLEISCATIFFSHGSPHIWFDTFFHTACRSFPVTDLKCKTFKAQHLTWHYLDNTITYIYIYLHIYIYTYIYIHTYRCIYVYVNLCAYIYIYIDLLIFCPYLDRRWSLFASCHRCECWTSNHCCFREKRCQGYGARWHCGMERRDAMVVRRWAYWCSCHMRDELLLDPLFFESPAVDPT